MSGDASVISETVKYFEAFNALVPVYLEKDDTENNKFQQHKKNVPGQSTKASLKRKKDGQAADAKKSNKKMKTDTEKPVAAPVEDDDEANSASDDEMAPAPAEAPKRKKGWADTVDAKKDGPRQKKSTPVPTIVTDSADGTTIEELRDKLKAKIASLQPKRKERDFEKPDKKKRKLERKEAAKEKKTKVAPQKKAEEPKQAPAPAPAKEKPVVKPKKTSKELVPEDIIFGAIADKADEETTSFSKAPKKKADKVKLLKKVEAFEEKLSSMDPEEARQLKKEKAVSSAMLRAQGVTIKDDKKLLKKSIKRDQAKKAKSARQWANRLSPQKDAKPAPSKKGKK